MVLFEHLQQLPMGTHAMDGHWTIGEEAQLQLPQEEF
jgi:hypothetical protein